MHLYINAKFRECYLIIFGKDEPCVSIKLIVLMVVVPKPVILINTLKTAP